MEKSETSGPAGIWRDVWVWTELIDGGAHPCAMELLGKARELADALGCHTAALVIGGEGAAFCAPELIAAGADRVLLVTGESFRQPDEEIYADAAAQLITEQRPEILLFGATEFGRSFAPRVAARVQTGLTADCTGLSIDPETRLLRQTRPAFGGNLMATIVCAKHRPQMATVRPGVLPAPRPDPTRTGKIEPCAVTVRPGRTEILSVVRNVAEGRSISNAEIIVSAGRGIGTKKNLRLVKELAELLGGEYGVSRPLVNLGWGEYTHQIGQTGAAVAPKLLITCGISGAIQHLAGIAGAETVIAINTDPDAPIFSRADYAVVGDCIEVLQELIDTLKNPERPQQV
jgi:electron transfer flavoprotein alpha subunit